MAGLRQAVRAAVAQTRKGFTSLRESPRDLYIVFALKVLESYNYFSLSRLFTLYLTEEFGVSDYRAGFYYGLWGTLLTAYGFLLGGLIDFLGVRGSLVICFLLNIGSRLVMAATQSRVMLLAMLLGPNTIAGALGVPVMTIGVKRYTHEGNRGFAFSLFYSLMNVAALTQGVIMDTFRIGLKHGFNIPSLPDHSLLNSGSRLFLASGCVTSLIGLVISFTLSEHSLQSTQPKLTGSEALDASVHSRRTDSSLELELPTSPEVPLLGAGGSSSSGAGEGSGSSDGGKASAGSSPLHHRPHSGSAVAAASVAEAGGASGLQPPHPQQQQNQRGRAPRRSAAEVWEGARAVLSSKGFWKYMAMCIFTVNLKSVFRHLDATLPKFQLRAFGCDTPIGLIYSINPAMIVLLVPVVGAMTTGFSHFDMIHLGGYVSALSPFWMVAFDTEWATAAFVAMLSLGEAIWSPRWYDYSMGVAPDGREGIFTALASAPLFAAMLPTGMISGALLQAYCPDNGQCGDREDEQEGGGSSPGRRLLVAAVQRGGAWLQRLGAAAAGGAGAGAAGLGDGEAAGPPVPPGVYTCDGRMLWLIVGCITLSSPLLVLLTQRWVRPDPRDFPRLAVNTRAGTATEGECFDVNEADPLGLLENVYEARLLHSYDAETGGSSGGRTGTEEAAAVADASGFQPHHGS